MLTLFTIPKPFSGSVGDIQRTAIESWQEALWPNLQIVLVGDDEGVADAAREARVDHAGGLLCNERGTPRLDSAFSRVDEVARYPLRCLVNADIVLLDDFRLAVERIAAKRRDFLIVGESRDLALPVGSRLSDPEGRAQLRTHALAEGRLRGYAALDFFVFQQGHFGDLPPFLIGRACFDNWLVWRARQAGPVIDVTRCVVSIHQSHDYSHVPGGFEEAYYGDEAKWNERLAGGRAHIYTLHDATHRLYPGGVLVRYWGSTLRVRESARKARVRLRSRPRASHTLRLVGVFPEPTPYRSPLFDAVASIEGIDLSVLYAAKTVAGRTWAVEPRHTHWVMRGFRLPAAERVLRHEYPVNWAIWRALFRLRPHCVIVSGWSTFAAQATIVWCRLLGIPYLLVVESHDRDVRASWRRAIKGTVVPRVVKGAAGVLVTGTLARESMLERGAPPDRIRVFANTIDVAAFGERADRLAERRPDLRAEIGLGAGDVAVLCVARLSPEKGIDTLVRAAGEVGDPNLVVVVVGEGPERSRLERLASDLSVHLVLLGDVKWERIVETYAAADVFALLSAAEPWGVVVNEAAACGLPLILSAAVGAAHDLVKEGVNGRVVPSDDPSVAAMALRELAADPARRAEWGAASRKIAATWGYEPSVGGLIELVKLAVSPTVGDAEGQP